MNRPVNILHTIDTTGPGGAETVFLNLIRNLDSKCFKPHIMLMGEGWVYNEVVKSGLTPCIIRPAGAFDWRYLLSLVSFIKKNKIGLVHSHLFGSNVYCSLAGLICRVPVISTFHGMVDTSAHDKLLALKCRIINLGSKKVVFVSDCLKNMFCSNMPLDEHKAITIYNGIDLDKFSGIKRGLPVNKLGYTSEQVVIGSVGNIRPAKGYDVLIKAAALLKEVHPECRFVIAGEGSGKLFDEILAMRKKCGLKNIVNFLGFCSNVEDVFANIDIFLLPSTSEGFSISTIEAMAAGVPVIVTDSGGPTEIVINRENGLVIESDNPEAIVEAIEACILNRSDNNKRASRARVTVRKKFSIEAMTEQYMSLYE